ncbi:hypothetical protein HQ563_03040 [bacterium]|nr:hypothetical protein [bacterium]
MLKQESDPKQRKKNSQNHKLKRGILIAVPVIAIAVIAWAKFSGDSGLDEAGGVFKVRRGDLRISVAEPGKIEAKKSVALTCDVEGQSTIISIVPEGTYVKEGDVLVELDSADLRERIDSQEITVKSAENASMNANEAFEIQENQNESDIKAAELSRDFAQIDLKKYTGEAAYSKALEAYKKQTSQSDGETKVAALAPHFVALNPEKDYEDGDWRQQLLTAQNNITTARTSLKLAENKLKGTEKLRGKDYVTRTELEADQFSYDKANITLEQRVEAKNLLIKYDHPKELAKYIADYEESEKELGRSIRRASSQLAQKESDRDTKEATYTRQQVRLDKLKDQLKKSTIVAPQPGLVIYSSSSGDRFGSDRGLIAEGENVWERQKIIQLPDLSTLKVDVNVHESVRDMIKPGQDTIITVEALSRLMLRGHVEKVAILPDSGRNWMSPDLTVYSTSIIIDDQSDALKPGMTAKAEIIIADLKGVLYVPVHAVTVRGEQEVCFLMKGSERIVTPVEVGLSNDNYIEIKSGLKKGDRVLTYAPITLAQETPLKRPKGAESEKKETSRPSEASGQPKATEATEETPRQLPAEMLEKAKAFLQNLTPEQKKELGIDENTDLEKMTPEQMKNLFRKIMPRRGGPRPAGEGMTRGPRGEGRRP